MRALTASAALFAAGGALAPSVAAAAGEDEHAVVVRHTRLPLFGVRGLVEPRPLTEPTMMRETDWLRLSLSDDLSLRLGPFQLDDSNRAWDGGLGQFDLRSDMWSAAPRAMTSMATAATSLLTSGLSVFEVWRGGQLRARHGLRMYWRSRGVTLAWRVEF